MGFAENMCKEEMHGGLFVIYSKSVTASVV